MSSAGSGSGIMEDLMYAAVALVAIGFIYIGSSNMMEYLFTWGNNTCAALGTCPATLTNSTAIAWRYTPIALGLVILGYLVVKAVSRESGSEVQYQYVNG